MKKRKGRAFKAILGVATVATSLLIGMTAACATNGGNDEEEEKNPSKLDTQIIKNGNFEFYDDNKGLYPISNPDNWSYSSNGSSSTSKSGVIDVSKKGWDYLTDTTLPATLEANDDLDSDDENKKDYNGAMPDDMLYANPHEALQTDATEEDKVYIKNPGTHKYSLNSEGQVVDASGNVVPTHTDDDGNILRDDNNEVVETSVLMLHNYRSLSDYKGTEAYYKSSTTVTLEANTACKISVWVKTSDLYFDGADNSRTEVKSERGAYIKVSSQVGGNSVDDVVIKNINTEKLLQSDDAQTTPANNGWVQYTLYIDASTFADTTVTVTLGLGESGVYSVEGYAFFDDLEYTKYKNHAELLDANPDFSEQIKDVDFDENTDGAGVEKTNTTQPLAPNASTTFRVDKVKVQTEDESTGNLTTVEKFYNSADDTFHIDFSRSASITEGSWNLNDSITAGLTVEKTNQGKFVSVIPDANNNYTITTAKLDNLAGANLPTALVTNGLNVKDDLITVVNVTDQADWQFKAGYKFNDVLTDALKTAATLPGVENGSTDAFVIVSNDGAAYEAHIKDDKFILNAGEYALVSFWMKPSEVRSGNAATVNVVDVNDEDNVQSFGVSAASITPVNIGDEKDVYNGWVKCFVRVANTCKTESKQFKLVLNYGNTTIKGTEKSGYNEGWIALANVSIMDLDEDVYGYTSGGSFSATLEFTDEKQSVNSVFDTAEETIHKESLAKPSSYNGVNGASINIAPTGEPASEYDAMDQNRFAGIVKKDNFSDYIAALENSSDARYIEWLAKLKDIENISSNGETELWNGLFGRFASQPLVIVNSERKINGENKIYNYGYVTSASSTVAANGYSAVSVRVKASQGAIANIYLVEDKENNRSVLNYELPKYTFWYDDDGNILKGEPKEDATPAEKKANIAYTLRKDGLYENGDGKLYANLYNLSKYYDAQWYENSDFYDAGGALKSYEYVKKHQGENFYDATGANFAPHHLIAGGEANNKVYEYVSGTGAEACYYYMESEKPNKEKLVYAIDTEVASVRYDSNTDDSTPYSFTIDTTTEEGRKYADKWVNVTFYLRAGSEEKKYKLELWSGSRDKKSDYEGANNSYVVFDYSGLGSSLDESKYTSLINEYTDKIANDYKSKLDNELDNNSLTLAELEKLASDAQIANKYAYAAKYYSFSLYDSEAFIPFNGEVNTDGTGYSFNYSEYDETLAFLKLADDFDENNISFSSFIDYSVVDKDIEIIGEPQAPDSGSDSDTDTTGETDGNFWLLLASIVLVAAILLAMIAIFIRSFVLKRLRRKTAGKNSYNFNKNKRYVKKYVKANGEAPEITEGEVDESLLSDQPKETEEEATDGEISEDNAEGENSEEPATAETEDKGEQSETNADGAENADAKSEDTADNADEAKPEDKDDGRQGEEPATTEESGETETNSGKEEPDDGNGENK